jgi:hypothetical protein
MNDWISNTPTFVATLPVVEFPFDCIPEIYVPDRTVLHLPDGARAHAYLWCYLERKSAAGRTKWKPASLSPARVAALPKVIERLSKWSRFNAVRAVCINNCFRFLSQFIRWADGVEHKGKFELLLTDANLALEALKSHHTYLRQLLQSNRIGRTTAARRDHQAINILSLIHDRSYSDDIEALSDLACGGTKPPQEQEVMQFMSTLQAIFDSAVRQILRDGDETDTDGIRHRVIRVSAMNDAGTVTLPQSYAEDRLMELACVAFAGLAIGDSGANLAQIQAYEEPEDLLEQLAQPDRVNLTQKAIKFRAGGKPVPVHLTTITLSRLRAYLKIRERLVARLNGRDIAPMFVQCGYGVANDRSGPRKPISVRALDSNFLKHLRCRIRSIGSELPPITLRQLRMYKQQHLVRKHGVKVAAETMGHSVATAIAKYCKAQESVRDNEMGQFLKSLTSTVLVPSRGLPEAVPTVRIAVGSCKEESNPVAIDVHPVVNPDCKKTEGCFFCAQYRVHADETDLRKLLSCRHVLQQLAPLQGESIAADRVYVAVIDRIGALLEELRCRIPQEYQQIAHDVQVAGNLSRYWAVKLQQLHLLGLLSYSGPTS